MSLFSRSSFVLLLGIWGLLGLAGWAMAGWLPAYFGERFHLTQSVAGFTATVVAPSSLASSGSEPGPSLST